MYTRPKPAETGKQSDPSRRDTGNPLARRRSGESNGKPRIVAIDDDRTLLHLLRNLLREHGYEVIARTSGVDAYETIKEASPVSVVLDPGPGGHTGLSLLNLLVLDPSTT